MLCEHGQVTLGISKLRQGAKFVGVLFCCIKAVLVSALDFSCYFPKQDQKKLICH